jgi:transketolase
MNEYQRAFPNEATQLRNAIAGEYGDAWLQALPTVNEKVATRKASETVIQAIAPHLPTLIGGSADLNESTFTAQKS